MEGKTYFLCRTLHSLTKKPAIFTLQHNSLGNGMLYSKEDEGVVGFAESMIGDDYCPSIFPRDRLITIKTPKQNEHREGYSDYPATQKELEEFRAAYERAESKRYPQAK